MVAHRLRPENLEERLIFWPLVLLWPLWATGLLLVTFSFVGWTVAGIAVARRLGWFPVTHNHVERPLPVIASAWLVGMAIMLVALIVAHIDYGYDSIKTIKSTIGWVKGWGLIGATVFAGSMAHVRPQLLFRAFNILGLQTALLTPFMVLIAVAGLPTVFYISPLAYVFGPDELYYAVGFHSRDSGRFGFRLSYFAPWAPAAAFFGVIAFVFALFDKSAFWRYAGLTGALCMCLLSQSRLAVVAIPLIGFVLWMTARITRPWLLAVMATTVVASMLFIDPLIEVARDLEAAFTGARADSSRVRATLQRIALHRWETEAFWFGHATVVKGPHLVEYMYIGSHHTWFGLLFVKGVLGFLACLLPFVWTLMELFVRAMRDRVAQAGLGAALALGMFSFGENLETMAYLIWPAFLLIGICAKRRISFPAEERQAPQKLRELVAAVRV
jgi:hypothetical protein